MAIIKALKQLENPPKRRTPKLVGQTSGMGGPVDDLDQEPSEDMKRSVVKWAEKHLPVGVTKQLLNHPLPPGLNGPLPKGRPLDSPSKRVTPPAPRAETPRPEPMPLMPVLKPGKPVTFSETAPPSTVCRRWGVKTGTVTGYGYCEQPAHVTVHVPAGDKFPAWDVHLCTKCANEMYPKRGKK